MYNSPEFIYEHVPSILQNSSPGIHTSWAVASVDIVEKAAPVSMRPTPIAIGNVSEQIRSKSAVGEISFCAPLSFSNTYLNHEL